MPLLLALSKDELEARLDEMQELSSGREGLPQAVNRTSAMPPRINGSPAGIVSTVLAAEPR